MKANYSDVTATRPRRCPDCGKAFHPYEKNKVRCNDCYKLHASQRRKEQYYNPKPDASSECWGCAFLDDCRYKVRRNQDPYCFASNAMSYLFVMKYVDGDNNQYAAGGRDESSRGQIAKSLRAYKERRGG